MRKLTAMLSLALALTASADTNTTYIPMVTVPYVRAQIFRLHGHPASSRTLLATDAGAAAAVTLAVALDPAVVAGAAAVASHNRPTARNHRVFITSLITHPRPVRKAVCV